jgi:hypothetical protein
LAKAARIELERNPKVDRPRRPPRQSQPQHVAEIVPGVGEQRQRAGQHAGDRLGGDIPKVQRNPDRKGAPEIDLAVRVSVVIVIHAMPRHGNRRRTGGAALRR